MDLRKYLIRRTKAGAPVFLMTHPETAKRYGWATRFEGYIEGKWSDPETGLVYLKNPRLPRKAPRGGVQIQISRHPSRGGAVAGQNNKFRVSGQASFADLCEIAKFTDCEWHWMTSFNGTRWTREEWLSFHDAYLFGRAGEVVPRKARLRAKPRTTDPVRPARGHYREPCGVALAET